MATPLQRPRPTAPAAWVQPDANAPPALPPSHLNRWPRQTNALAPVHPARLPDCQAGGCQTLAARPSPSGPPPYGRGTSCRWHGPAPTWRSGHWAHSRGPRQTKKPAAPMDAWPALQARRWHARRARPGAWGYGPAPYAPNVRPPARLALGLEKRPPLALGPSGRPAQAPAALAVRHRPDTAARRWPAPKRHATSGGENALVHLSGRAYDHPSLAAKRCMQIARRALQMRDLKHLPLRRSPATKLRPAR